MAYHIFLDGRLLPVTTDKLTTKHDLQSTEYDIIGLGKVQVPGTRELRTVEFQTEFPAQARSYVTGDWEEPEKILKRLKALQERGQSLRYVAIGDCGDKTTMLVTLEGLTVDEVATEDGDYTVTIRLKEYREFGAVLTNVEHLPRPGKVPVQESVVVRPGQTLQDACGGSLKDVMLDAMKNAPSNVMGKYTLYQAAGVGGALKQVINPALIKENKPIYRYPGQVEFSEDPTIRTIEAPQWGKDLGRAINDTGKAIKSVADSVGKGIKDAMEIIPK